MSNDDFAKDKDMQEWEDLFKDIFDDGSPDADEFVSRFDREMKKTLAEAATKIEVDELQQKDDLSEEKFWKNECEKLLLQSKEKDIQIVDLTREKIELYNKTKDIDMTGALLSFISCVLGLVLPFAALGILQVKDMFASASNSLIFLGILFVILLLASGVILWFFVPGCALLVSALNLEKSHQEGKILKIFLSAVVAVVILAAIVIFIL